MKKLLTFVIIITLLFINKSESVLGLDIYNLDPSIGNTTRGVDINPDYVFALHTTNRFLHAWLIRDYKDGMNYISDDLKKSVSEEELITFFSGTSDPHHMAYEVVGWRYVNEETIKFHVWLYEVVTSESSKSINHPEPFYVEVVRINKDKWLVNTLPMRENYYNGADNV